MQTGCGHSCCKDFFLDTLPLDGGVVGRRSRALHSPQAKEPKGASSQSDALDADRVLEMAQYLEVRGGIIGCGKFTSAFEGMKKSQAEEHFTLVPVGGYLGGSWQITLPGVEPQPPAARSCNGHGARGEGQGMPKTRSPHDGASLVPLGRLVGLIKAYDAIKGYGFIACHAGDIGDVYYGRVQSPAEVQLLPRGKVVGLSVEFDGALRPDRKPHVVSIQLPTE